jgi:hypothetical protein
MVLRTYADVQTMLLQFLEASHRHESASFTQWLQQQGKNDEYSVTIHDSVEAAPEIYDVLTAVDRWTPERLREAYGRDMDAEVFSEEGLMQILTAARSQDAKLAFSLVPFATEVQPRSIQVLQSASAVAESAAQRTTARQLAARCVAIEFQQGDWRAQAAHEECRERVARLDK